MKQILGTILELKQEGMHALEQQEPMSKKVLASDRSPFDPRTERQFFVDLQQFASYNPINEPACFHSLDQDSSVAFEQIVRSSHSLAIPAKDRSTSNPATNLHWLALLAMSNGLGAVLSDLT